MEEGSLSKEIYSEILQTSNTRLDPTQTVVDDLAVQEDDSLFCLDGELGDASELEREWQKRFQQHHAIGYHDGLMAGIDASSQEGFNIGFKESVLAGYKWGIVRGITSAFACLPCDVKERIIETQERRNQLEGLYESVHSLSTIDALQLFHSDMMRKEKWREKMLKVVPVVKVCRRKYLTAVVYKITLENWNHFLLFHPQSSHIYL